MVSLHLVSLTLTLPPSSFLLLLLIPCCVWFCCVFTIVRREKEDKGDKEDAKRVENEDGTEKPVVV